MLSTQTCGGNDEKSTTNKVFRLVYREALQWSSNTQTSIDTTFDLQAVREP